MNSFAKSVLPRDVLARAASSFVSSGADVFLCAPFITRNALRWVLSLIDDEAQLTLVTRWRLDELIMGISDVRIWEDVKARPHSRMFLRWNLHAKYYRFGDQILIGSANLTMPGLGIGRDHNLEILETAPAGFPREHFESLLESGKEVDDEEYRMISGKLSEVPREQQQIESYCGAVTSEEGEVGEWLPRIRNPECLWLLYHGSSWEYSDSLLETTVRDSSEFSVPTGLPKEVWRSVIGQQLREKEFICDVFEFCATPRRFGEVAKWLREKEPELLDSESARRLWQLTIRWIAYFLPDKIEVAVPGEYSEVVRLVP